MEDDLKESMPVKRYVNLIVPVMVLCTALGILLWGNLQFKNGRIFYDNYHYFCEFFSGDFTYDNGYSINGSEFSAEIDKPWIGIIDENGILATSAKIIFEEPLTKDITIQVYFSAAELTEGQSRMKNAKKGTREIIINFPRNTYRELRFDIRGSFKLSSIQLSTDVAGSPEDKIRCLNITMGVLFIISFAYLFWKYGVCIVRYICNLNPIACFAGFTFIWGVAFTFLIVPWQMPDEYNHLTMICEGFQNKDLSGRLFDEMPLDRERIMFHPNEKIDREQIKEAIKKVPSYTYGECMPKGISKELIRHFPAAVGVLLGILLKLPVFWVIILGRLFSLAFYIAICCITLHLVPNEKELFKIVMLLPMCIQQAASLSYDAVLIPMCFLFIAYIMHLKFIASEIGIRESGILLGILFCIAIAKIPYTLLGVLFLLLPIQKIHIRAGKYEITGDMIYKWRYGLGIAGLAIMAAAIYLFRENQWIKLVYASVCQFTQTLYLFGVTWNKFAKDLMVSLIGNFGYLDTPAELWFVIIGIVFVIVTAVTNVKKETKDFNESVSLKQGVWSGRDRVIMCLTWMADMYLITLSMVSHTAKMLFYGTEAINVRLDWHDTLYQIPYIGGGQGRYYIPILLLALLPMPKLLEAKEKMYRILGFIFYT